MASICAADNVIALELEQEEDTLTCMLWIMCLEQASRNVVAPEDDDWRLASMHPADMQWPSAERARRHGNRATLPTARANTMHASKEGLTYKRHAWQLRRGRPETIRPPHLPPELASPSSWVTIDALLAWPCALVYIE